MTEEFKLYLPKYCILEIAIRENANIPEAAKIYFGELAVLASKYDMIFATDEQLAEMKGVSLKTIKNWNSALEKEGFIYRHTEQDPYKDEKGELRWKKKRMMLLDQDPQKLITKVQNFTLSNEGVKNYPIDGKGKNLPFNKNKKENQKEKLASPDPSGHLSVAESSATYDTKESTLDIRRKCIKILENLGLNEQTHMRLAKSYKYADLVKAVELAHKRKDEIKDINEWLTRCLQFRYWEENGKSEGEKVTEEKQKRFKLLANAYKACHEQKGLYCSVDMDRDTLVVHDGLKCVRMHVSEMTKHRFNSLLAGINGNLQINCNAKLKCVTIVGGKDKTIIIEEQ
ncbi:MAG: hypothetical protein PQJ44_07035 [Sphaerochaetaceae bacterium]|nr:hypothetical protein [Sphaerochaetaceae bacterium]